MLKTMTLGKIYMECTWSLDMYMQMDKVDCTL